MNTTVDINVICSDIAKQFDQYDWFYDCIYEKPYLMVYVNHMNYDVMTKIPETLYGMNVKIAYSQYLECDEKYGKKSAFILSDLKETDLN